MDKLTFISPSMDWERELLAYKEAFGGEHLHGGSRLQEIDDLSGWLNHLEKAGSASTCGEGRSPSSASERGIRPWWAFAISATTSIRTI